MAARTARTVAPSLDRRSACAFGSTGVHTVKVRATDTTTGRTANGAVTVTVPHVSNDGHAQIFIETILWLCFFGAGDHLFDRAPDEQRRIRLSEMWRTEHDAHRFTKSPRCAH